MWGGGNHRTDRGLFIWWLTCLSLLPLEFVETRSMGQSSAYRLNTWMAGVGWGGGWDQTTRGAHSTSNLRELGSVCLYSAMVPWETLPADLELKPCGVLVDTLS